MVLLYAGIIMSAVYACAGGYTNEEKLIDAINMYNEGMKWGKMDDMLLYIPKDEHERFFEKHKDWGRDISISGYQVVRQAYDKEKEIAIVQIRISWFRVDEQVLKSTVFQHKWEKDDKDRWMITEETVVEGPPI